jgi:hypothetical protein
MKKVILIGFRIAFFYPIVC